MAKMKSTTGTGGKQRAVKGSVCLFWPAYCRAMVI
ncbi:hypothetical protein PF005_g32264 [Phytophthora fragariae]|uniref:Uncharacterized protein n=1 Tax=Phytophthora fragariae TaxID=53985 RepID=A0A6A3VDY1_9STRA|nr:hypothetical protein PF005_g32264 [Phytophthora fragariae]KAE9242030.1 hypothetical protein PF004_g6784 [Phytophthora fragariae]